jgi:hypothetical protein
MMDIRKILTILALALCGSATADIFTVVDAVETSTANVNVPTSTNGHLTFKPCADVCDEAFMAIRLTPETQYVIRGQRVNFADFRRMFNEMRRGKDAYALVSYDTEKRIVTSVRLGF